jgi:hypothetical protein
MSWITRDKILYTCIGHTYCTCSPGYDVGGHRYLHCGLSALVLPPVSATVCCPGTVFRAQRAPEQTVHLTVPEITHRNQIYCPKCVVLHCLRQAHYAQVSQTCSVHYTDIFYILGRILPHTHVCQRILSVQVALVGRAFCIQGRESDGAVAEMWQVLQPSDRTRSNAQVGDLAFTP